MHCSAVLMLCAFLFCFVFVFLNKSPGWIFTSFYKNQVVFLQPHSPANLEILRLFKNLYSCLLNICLYYK